MRLIRSKDRKVANSVTASGNVNIANAFGLPAGKAYSCPGATEYCESICYAGKLEKVYTNVRKALINNFDILRNASMYEMTTMLDDMITEFEAECDRKSANRLFRIHWDGDFFSTDYTMAWAMVIDAHPDTRFWVYTRVPEAAVLLNGMPNLTVYFSADRDNIANAPAGVRIAYVDDYFVNGKAVLPKATRCPENNKAIPLITPKGSACVTCGLCVFGRNDVLFSKNKNKEPANA
jgi:hypothetical protein